MCNKGLKVALDSAPRWGAGRVEDTVNHIGHALELVVRCVAMVTEHNVEQVCQLAKLELLGHPSLKSALDIDWDDKHEQQRALNRLLDEVNRLKQWLNEQLPEKTRQSPLKEALEQLHLLIDQDVEPDPDGAGSHIKKGVAKERQISISDPDMRHGRKSKSKKIKGFKRFIARELEHGLILGVTVQPANRPEQEATQTLQEQAQKYGKIEELHIDRGFLASDVVGEMHEDGVEVVCRPWKARNKGRFTKEDFELDLEQRKVTCPAGRTASMGQNVARFSGKECDKCGLREQCTKAKPGRGRSISIHKHEHLLQQLRGSKATSEGRARLRQRVAVEHSLAHICNRQGPKARYRGTDKNVLDLCRYAVIENLFVADRAERAAA